MTVNTFEQITTDTPYKPLLVRLPSHAGRNNRGVITVRHKGGGHKKLYRMIDFYFHDKKGVPAKVETIEYDPYRTAWIALVCYKDGERRYVLAHKDMKVGDSIMTDEKLPVVPGNRMAIGNIPVGVGVYNVELYVGKGACSVRSAGAQAIIMSQESLHATLIKMPSGEIRYVNKKCYATVGQVSNIDNNLIVIGKAGRSRHMGIRPTVLGKSMNPVDHPHGGGEGHTSIGLKRPKTPWGKPALGVKTRGKKKITNMRIVRTRKGETLV